jgi:hypothetical protein
MQQPFHELSFYTLSLGDIEFIHQHSVDAFTAQNADIHSKPISIIFALAGLYLHLEKNFTGKEVQLAHMQMAKRKKVWPLIQLPGNRGQITVTDVLSEPPGKARNEKIHDWCADVWAAYRESHAIMKQLVSELLSEKEN